MIDSRHQHLSAASSSLSDESDPRRRILSAAYREFVNRGFNGARTRDIAGAAQVNIAMVHYYFGDKEKLYRKVTLPIFFRLGETLKTALSSSQDPQQQVEALVDAYFDFLGEYPDFPRLMIWEALTGGRNLQMIFQTIISENRGRLAEGIIAVFERAAEAGTFSSQPPVQAAISLVGLCVFPFAAREIIDVVFSKTVAEKSFIEERRQHVKQLLIRGLSA